MKELINILCPEIKPVNEWNSEDKQVAISFVILAIGLIATSIIETL